MFKTVEEENDFFARMRHPDVMHPRPWSFEMPLNSVYLLQSGSGKPVLKIDATTYTRQELRPLLTAAYVDPSLLEFERAFNSLPSGLETTEALAILAQGRYELKLPWKLRFSLWRQRVFGGRKAK